MTFLSLKQEEDMFGNPEDVGKPWNWNPNWEASEAHWLKCAVVIPENARCYVCGER